MNARMEVTYTNRVVERFVVLTECVTGSMADAPFGAFTIEPGRYALEDFDDGDLYLSVDGFPESVGVLVTPEDLGRVECPACRGRGSFTYRESDFAFDTIECDVCGELGSVTPEQAAAVPRYPWGGA